MSDYDPRRFQLGLLDPAFEQLESGQQAVTEGVERRIGNMREDRISGLRNVQQVIEAGDEAASHLDPNDPDDAPVLERWNQERGRLVEQTGTLPGPDLLETSVGATGSQALSDVRRRSRVAQEEREEDVARLEAELEEGLIVARGGQEVRVTNASGEVQRQLQENELTFRAEEGNRDRQFEKAMQQAAQDWEGDENQRDRVLQRALQEAGFDFQGDQNARDRALREARQALDADIAQMQNDIEQGRLNILGRELDAAQNERAYNRLLNHANRIQDIDDPEQRQQEEEAFIENLMRRRGALSKPDIQELADFVRLPQSVEDRLTDAQATTEEARQTLLEAQAGQAEAATELTLQRAQTEGWNLQVSQLEANAEMNQRAHDAASNGNVAGVRSAIALARTIMGNDRYPDEVQDAASSILQSEDELLERAEQNFEIAGDANVLSLDRLRAQVANEEISVADARVALSSTLAQRFDSEEELNEWLASETSKAELEAIYGEGNAENARQRIRLEFKHQKRLEEEGELQQQGQALLQNPDTQSPDEWREDVIAHFTQDEMWGPEGEPIITRLANANLRAARLDDRSAMADLRRVSATAANLLAQADLYDLQGDAALLEANSSQAAALLENLGEMTDLLEGPMQLAITEMQQMCTEFGQDSQQCEDATAFVDQNRDAFGELYNLVLQSVGFDINEDGPMMTRSEYADTLEQEAQRLIAGGMSTEEAAGALYRDNDFLARTYPDTFQSVFPTYDLPNDQDGEQPTRPARRAPGWINDLGPDDPDEGVDPGRYRDRAWMRTPLGDKEQALLEDPAFQDFIDVARDAQDRGAPLTDEELQDAARRFGITQQNMAQNILVDPLLPDFLADPGAGPQSSPDVEGMRQIVEDVIRRQPTNTDSGGGRQGDQQGGGGSSNGDGASTDATSEGLRMETASPELVEALLNQETAGGRHLDEEGNLVESSAGALGAGQILPTTAWRPGGEVDPMIEITDREDREKLETWQAEREVARREGDRARDREIREEMDQFIQDQGYMDQVGEEDYRAFAEIYLNDLLRQFNGNVELALAAYNDGPADVRLALQRAQDDDDPEKDWKDYLPGGRETRQYIPGVLNRMEIRPRGGGSGQPQQVTPGNTGARRRPRMNEVGDLV